jgi:ketosteroid isomerase-like protein
MNPDFVAFIESMDRCWMEGRFPELEAFLATDVVFVSPDGVHRGEGSAHAIESYRQFLSHAQVKRFETSDHIVTLRGDTAIVEYRWQMDWTSDGADYSETGREVLVLARRDGSWLVVWRTQIPSAVRAA